MSVRNHPEVKRQRREERVARREANEEKGLYGPKKLTLAQIKQLQAAMKEQLKEAKEAANESGS